jgi:hypothetical protein
MPTTWLEAPTRPGVVGEIALHGRRCGGIVAAPPSPSGSAQDADFRT